MATKIKALGKEWTLPSEPTVGIILEFRDWIKEQEGDPFDGLAEIVNLLPKEEAVKLVKDAAAVRDQLKCFSLKCPLAQKYLNTEIGAIHFSWLMLRENHPDITMEEACSVDMAFARQSMDAEAKRQALASTTPRASARPSAKPEGNGLTPTSEISLLAGAENHGG